MCARCVWQHRGDRATHIFVLFTLSSRSHKPAKTGSPGQNWSHTFQLLRAMFPCCMKFRCRSLHRQSTSTSVAALPCSPTNIDHVGGDVVHTIVVAIHIPGFVIYVWSCIRFADSMRVHCGEMLLVQNSRYEYISLMIIKKLIQREIMHGVFVVSLASLLFDWLYEGCHEPGWYAWLWFSNAKWMRRRGWLIWAIIDAHRPSTFSTADRQPTF